MAFGVFDIIYFRVALKALDVGQFSWCMYRKNEIRTKVLSLKSSNFSKFYPDLLKLVEKHNRCTKTGPGFL